MSGDPLAALPDRELPVPCLMLVTDRHQAQGRPLEAVVAAALDGGVNVVQLREKDLTARELWGEAAHPRDTVHAELWEEYLERA